MVRMVRNTLIAALLMFLVAAPASGAFWKSKEEPEKDRLYLKAPLFNKFPAMQVIGGELSRGGMTGWMLDGTALVMTKDSRVDGAGPGLNRPLAEGRRALVLGYRQGEVMVVHFLTLQDPDQAIQRGNYLKRPIDKLPSPAPVGAPQ